MASMVRESSPPETTLASGLSSSPGLAERRNSTVSAPRGPMRQPPEPARQVALPGLLSREAASAKARVVHAEGAELALDQALELSRPFRSCFRQDRRFARRGGRADCDLALRLLRDGVVALEPIERPGDLRPVRGDGGRGLAILALDAADGVEPLVDLPQAIRVHHGPLAKHAYARHGVLDVGLRALEGLDGRRRRPGRSATGPAGAPRRARASAPPPAASSLQDLHDFLETGEDSLGVLQAPALGPKLVLLALAELHGVDL